MCTHRSPLRGASRTPSLVCGFRRKLDGENEHAEGLQDRSASATQNQKLRKTTWPVKAAKPGPRVVLEAPRR